MNRSRLEEADFCLKVIGAMIMVQGEFDGRTLDLSEAIERVCSPTGRVHVDLPTHLYEYEAWALILILIDMRACNGWDKARGLTSPQSIKDLILPWLEGRIENSARYAADCFYMDDRGAYLREERTTRRALCALQKFPHLLETAFLTRLPLEDCPYENEEEAHAAHRILVSEAVAALPAPPKPNKLGDVDKHPHHDGFVG